MFMNFEVFNLVYSLALIVIYRSLRLHYRLYIRTADPYSQKWWHDWPLLVIGLIFAVFLPLFTGFLISGLFGQIMLMLRSFSKKTTNTQFKLVRSVPVLATLMYWFGLLFGYGLMIFVYGLYLTGLVGRTLSSDWLYPILGWMGVLLAWALNLRYRRVVPINHLPILGKVKIQALLGIVALIFSTLSIGITYAVSPPSVPDDQTAYHAARIITFNILNLNSNKFEPANYWENRGPYLADHLMDLNPDIFGVQEAYLAQLEFLNATLTNRNYTWSGVGRNDGLLAGEFAAIFFDTNLYSLLESGTFWFSDTPDQPSRFSGDTYRICSWVHLQLKTDESEFFVFNTHYGFSFELQLKASVLLNQRIAALTGSLPVILMGDFNMMNFYPFYLYLEGFGRKPVYDSFRLVHGYVNPFDATSAPTFNVNTDYGFHIDHLFISPNIVPVAIRTVKESYNGQNTYSDHYPVLLDCLILRLK
jgi:endonuclease/exonuclease/phosphatase family metal-dependent hydrolase